MAQPMYIGASPDLPSGVLVITVLTSPGRFSCPKDCHYCPNEPGQPRSYLSTEPAVLRGNQNNWDAVMQFNDRAETLYKNGHIVDKIELLVLGGTWSGYPVDYQEEFVRDLFYAANVFQADGPPRERKNLEDEQKENETASARIIGLTLETRPDFINRSELRRLRRYGCTRVQIGIQHVDDSVLIKINRGCTLSQCVEAIRMLKDAAFKVDIHIMPDLPGSYPELDKKMFEWILGTPWLQADQWKIYPCEVTPFSTIEKWYQEGLFVPYGEKDHEKLVDLLLSVKRSVHPWIRLNRVIRDIPNQSIIAGNAKTNLRQILMDEMSKRLLECKCIRCREVKDKLIKGIPILKIRRYDSTGGQEYFLSFETEDESTIFGFLRLRLPGQKPSAAEHPQNDAQEYPGADNDLHGFLKSSGLGANNSLDTRDTLSEEGGCTQMEVTRKEKAERRKIRKQKPVFPDLVNSALIRELHVYGQLVAHDEQKPVDDKRHQHTGMGRKLILAAEVIAFNYGYRKIAVIAGIGTREYYRGSKYTLEKTYMSKTLSAVSVYKHLYHISKTYPTSATAGDSLLPPPPDVSESTTKSDEDTTVVVSPVFTRLTVQKINLAQAVHTLRETLPPAVDMTSSSRLRTERKTNRSAKLKSSRTGERSNASDVNVTIAERRRLSSGPDIALNVLAILGFELEPTSIPSSPMKKIHYWINFSGIALAVGVVAVCALYRFRRWR
eukprot:GHVQ01002724.1.p1 GENE.GHVQ01002724.1~~GHVQ01002724.1.p1  ORF type:complete len:760 (+),score=58.09 GHVQ01002724.1:116-2281(+)